MKDCKRLLLLLVLLSIACSRRKSNRGIYSSFLPVKGLFQQNYLFCREKKRFFKANPRGASLLKLQWISCCIFADLTTFRFYPSIKLVSLITIVFLNYCNVKLCAWTSCNCSNIAYKLEVRAIIYTHSAFLEAILCSGTDPISILHLSLIHVHLPGTRTKNTCSYLCFEYVCGGCLATAEQRHLTRWRCALYMEEASAL